MAAIHISGTFAIATGKPATDNVAGFETLFGTPVLISGVVEGPEFATTHSDITIPRLSGRTEVLKGGEVGVATSLSWETIASDVGQAAVIAAAAARGTYSLRHVDASGKYHYAYGIIKDYAPNKPTQTSYDGGSVQFVPNFELRGQDAPA